MAKLWTGDEWRPLSPNEAAHRIDCGYIVLDDDDPRTLVNEPPSADPPKKATTSAKGKGA